MNKNLDLRKKALMCAEIEIHDLDRNDKDFATMVYQIMEDYINMDDDYIEILFSQYEEEGCFEFEKEE